MRDELSGLNVLLAVADKRSFTAAAAALRVTPSAVSQSLRALEQRLGVRLLQRTTRTVGLTEAGAQLVARLRPAIDSVRDALASLEPLRARPAGLLRLHIPRFAYLRVVQPRLAGFFAAYPEIRLDMTIDDEPTDLIAQGFDAGIHLGEMIGRDMIAVRVSDDHKVAIVGSPAYFAAHGKPRHPRDLHAHDCINYRQPARDAIYRWELIDGNKYVDIAVAGRLTFDDRDLAVQAAINGLGLAYTAETRVSAELADGSLVRVLGPWCPPFPGLFFYYASRAHIAPKLQALIDHLKQPLRKR